MNTRNCKADTFILIATKVCDNIMENRVIAHTCTTFYVCKTEALKCIERAANVVVWSDSHQTYFTSL